MRLSAEQMPSRRPGRIVATLLVAWGAAGCGDLGTGPLVEVSTDQPVPTLQLDEALPTLPEMVERWGGALPTDSLSARWSESWYRSAEEGALEREQIYRVLTPALARRFSPDDLEPLERRILGALAGVSNDLPNGAPQRLTVPVDGARQSARSARAARMQGEVEEALRHLLVAFDYLYGVSAEATAISMLHEAEDALRRNSSDDTYSARSRRRAERLVLGARDALEDGDDALALRRAFYGRQLAGEPGER